MPSGFVLPVYKITRLDDGVTATSTRQGGAVAIAKFYGEAIESFKSQLKLGWSRHVDTGARSFVFTTVKSPVFSVCRATYRVEPLLMQSELPTSKFIRLTASQLDNLVEYLRETKTEVTATTFSLKQLINIPISACYTPDAVEIDLHSDMFRVSFVSKRSRSRTSRTMGERYYLSVATMDQTETQAERTSANLRPKIKVYWHSELEQKPLMGRIQVCHLLLAARNGDHLRTILGSPELLHERRGFTEIEHITRELGRTSPQDLTFLSRQLQQQNVGRARMYLRDVDLAVAKAYRLSRRPTHLLTNAEHYNMERISMLRQPRPPLTAVQMGGPLASCIVMEWNHGQQRPVALCEAENSKQAQNRARRIKKKMIRSLGLLLAAIVCEQQ